MTTAVLSTVQEAYEGRGDSCCHKEAMFCNYTLVLHQLPSNKCTLISKTLLRSPLPPIRPLKNMYSC